MITYITKDGRFEFTTGLYVSMSHLLKLAIAVTVAGICTVLPALIPVLKSGVAALTANPKALVGISTTVLSGLRCAHG